MSDAGALDLPIVVEPDALEGVLGEQALLIVDLCNPQTSASAQVPGWFRRRW